MKTRKLIIDEIFSLLIVLYLEFMIHLLVILSDTTHSCTCISFNVFVSLKILKFGFILAVCTEFGLKFVMISQRYIIQVRRLHISSLLSNKNRENSKLNYVKCYTFIIINNQ